MKKQLKKTQSIESKPTKSDIVKANLLAALTKSLGIVSTACNSVGINRDTYYHYLATDEKFKQSVEGLQDNVLDFAESKLYKLVNDENPAAVFFLLKTKGKKRGYVERQEVDHTTKGESLNRPPLEFFESETETD